VFNDRVLGTNTVKLVATVNPASVTVTNSSFDYTIVGAGKISEPSGLNKQGNNTLTLVNSTANDYTGPTLISGGTLSVTNVANGGVASAIGKSSSVASNLVLAGGTLSYAGPTKAIDRGYSVQAAASTIETIGDLALNGPVSS